jgi:hypothetical protein
VRQNCRPRRGWSASESLMHLVLFSLAPAQPALNIFLKSVG